MITKAESKPLIKYLKKYHPHLYQEFPLYYLNVKPPALDNLRKKSTSQKTCAFIWMFATLTYKVNSYLFHFIQTFIISPIYIL